jgi:Uma2 family endonuclease
MKILKAKEPSRNRIPDLGFQRTVTPDTGKRIIYPDSDGKPMADNTKQFDWIVKIKENLERIYRDNPHVFIAGDLFWYPVEGNNKIRTAPDAMVVFGRPKEHRGSYRSWEEAHIPPQVVFEILSPGNRRSEMNRKFQFYQEYGVKEYYILDPDRIRLDGWIRTDDTLLPIPDMTGWTSPLLKIRFELAADDLVIYCPDGTRFLSTLELDEISKSNQRKAESERLRAEAAIEREESERQRAEAAIQREESERQRAEAAIQREESERQRAEAAIQREAFERREKERLSARLRELGIDI